MDKRGIAIFAVTVIGVTWAVQGLLEAIPWTRADGDLKGSFIHIAILMIPAFAALLASIVRRDPEYPKLTLWPVPKYPALAVTAIVALIFVIVYSGTTILGQTTPDWKMSGLLVRLARNQQVPIDPSFFLVAGFVITVLLGPTVYALACAGVEIGWRGYLFPKVLPMGRVRAHLVVGLLTAVWALPIVFNPFRNPARIPGQFLFLLGISIAVSAFLNELWLRRRHAGLTAVCAGCFVSHVTGIWQYLFPNAALPYSGTLGIVSILVWSAAAAIMYFLPATNLSHSPEPQLTEPIPE